MQLFSAEVRRNPHPLYERLRATSPVLREPSSGAFLLLDYESVKRALADQERFSSAASPGGPTASWLIFTDPPRHTELRALILRAFTPRAVAELEPRIRAISAELLDATRGRGEMDLVGEYAVPLPLRVIAEMLGAPPADFARFRSWSDAVLGLIHTVSNDSRASASVDAVRSATAEMREYLVRLTEERRTSPRDDLLSRLVHAEVDDKRLSADDILGFFQLLLIAGHETTTNLIGNTVLQLAEDGALLARVRASPELLPTALEEVLRCRSPVQAVFRKTKTDVDVRGQRIPEGSLVLLMLGSANRDPSVFPDADRFVLDRHPNPHVAFGQGIHFCIGAPLARLEARIAVADLVQRLERIELADPLWEPREAFHVHGPTRLRLRMGQEAGGAR